MSKISRDQYYMEMALVAAKRGTCDRRQVGAVLVHEDAILSTGFNGAPSGMPECDEAGHLLEHGHCVRTIHAEANAILRVGSRTIRRLAGPATIYTTTAPCMSCANIIINAGVKRIVWGEAYTAASHKSDRGAYAREAAQLLGIDWVPFPMGEPG